MTPSLGVQARTAPEAGVELLAALAEEGDALGPSRRGAAVAALAQRAPEVLALVGALASEPGDQKHPSECSSVLIRHS